MIKDKSIDVILDDRDERNAEEWFVGPRERDAEPNVEPVYQAPNDVRGEDHESDEDMILPMKLNLNLMTNKW